MPVIFNAIKKGVIVMTRDKDVSADNLNDDRLIMDFIKKRNAEGSPHRHAAAHSPRHGASIKNLNCLLTTDIIQDIM